MILPNINDAPLIRASLLINQEKSKKGYKSVQPEIAKMIETFGTDFDKRLHKSLFDEIEFKEIKTLMNSKNSRTQYFIQEFSFLLDRPDFISFFSEILMSTENTSSCQEIMDGCNKICKLSNENYIKLLLAFILSMNERFTAEAKKMLITKCGEIEKENKIEQLSQSTLQSLVLILDSFDEAEIESLNLVAFFNSSTNYSAFAPNTANLTNNSGGTASNILNDIKQLNDIEKMLETANDDPIEIEKIFNEIGPLMINNMLTSPNCDLLDYNLDEKRLANFILFLIKHQTWVEDKENKYLNKIFLKSINNEAFNSIDDVSDKKTINWNIDNFYKMFKKNFEVMDPSQVFTALDDPKFSIKDKKTFDFFISTLQKLKVLSNSTQFYSFILTKWNNELNQIEFLSFLINNQQNDSLSFRNYPGAKVKKISEVSSQVKNSNSVEPWLTIDLVQVLIKLAKGNHYMKVKELFDWPIQNIPEILLLALTAFKPEQDDFLYEELIREALPPFLNNHLNSFTLIEEIWNRNKDLLIKTVCTLYQSTPDLMNLSKILDISQKLKEGLLLLVYCSDYSFSVSLAILAVKRDFLHIEQWLKDRISKVGDDFIDALLTYIRVNLIANCKGNSTNKENVLEKAQLSIESLAIILENLITSISSTKISQRVKADIKEVYKQIFEIFDEIQVQPMNSEEIESAANALFQSMFKGDISVNDTIDTLIKYQKSIIQKESEIYACMIHCLLDEYRFYHQYPDKQLNLVATLFGQVINNKLIDGLIETIALKYILEGIKKGTGQMYNFGITALSQFVNKLHIWPHYLKSLFETKQLKNSIQLYDKVLQKCNDSINASPKDKSKERKVSSIEDEAKYEDDPSQPDNPPKPTNKDDNPNAPRGKTKLIKPIQVINIGNLSQMLGNDLSDSISPPTGDVVKSMNFIFNTMSKNNVIEKSNELKQLLINENIIRWFSNFFIINRISGENNNHQIYNDLISLIDNKELNKYLIKDTIYFIKKLLPSENLEKDIKEKNVLKNLGSWLGIMTLAKNKPILAKDLDLKEIIFDAYEKGKLSAIITFIARIIEHSSKTKVFHPKNPWIQAILSLLSEINAKPNLKNNLKYELDLLFKKLDLDLNSHPKSCLLEQYSVCLNSPDFPKQKDSSLDNIIDTNELKQKILQLDSYLSELLSSINSTNTANVISKQDLARNLMKMLNNSIKERIETIVERAVSISLVTTRELIIKDFMYEKDENKFKAAALNSIKSLAGSLAMVTCKEPLRTGINNQLKEVLLKNKIDNEVIEGIINQSHSDLLDIGCNYIYYYVIKKAIEKLQSDQLFLEEIDKRKNNLKFETKGELVTKIQSLPLILRPNPNGLSLDQYKIYENFDKTYENYFKYETSPKDKDSFLVIVLNCVKEALNPSTKIGKNYDLCMLNIQNASQEAKDSFNEEEQLICLDKIVVESGIDDDSISLELAMLSLKYSISAVKTRNILLLNVCSQLLKGWIKLVPDVSKEITNRVLTYDDIFVRFNVDLHSCFLKKNIFYLPDYEKTLFEYLDSASKWHLVKSLLSKLKNKGVIHSTFFVKIPSYMFDNHSKDYFDLFSKANSKLSSIFSSNRNKVIDYKVCKIKDQSTYKKFSEHCFVALNLIVEAMYPFEEFKVDKLKQNLDFIENAFINDEDRMNVFIMLITEMCIKGLFDESKPSNNLYPESEARCLFGLLSSVFSNKNNANNNLKLFSNVLYGIFRTFHQDYIKSLSSFNQRPYFKLFYNLIALLDTFDSNENALCSEYPKIKYLMMIADLFMILTPNTYSGFTLAWIDLISSKHFVCNFLAIDPKSPIKDNLPKYEKYLSLIIEIFIYLKSFSSEIISDYISKVVLDNVYRFLFLLCKSFPEFVSGYYYLLLVSLPSGSNFIQMKNLILQCSPVEIDKLTVFPEQIMTKTNIPILNKDNASIYFNIENIIQENNFKPSIDAYLEQKAANAVEDLANKITNSSKNDRETCFYHLNAIVIYLSQSLPKMIVEKKIEQSEVVTFFITLMKCFDNENRDHLIHSMLNELRYPSNQTIFFSCLIITVYTEINDEIIEEHIMKSLAERLLYKPLPWGLLLTVLHLTKSQRYVDMSKASPSRQNCDEILERIKDNALDIAKDQALLNYIGN